MPSDGEAYVSDEVTIQQNLREVQCRTHSLGHKLVGKCIKFLIWQLGPEEKLALSPNPPAHLHDSCLPAKRSSEPQALNSVYHETSGFQGFPLR